MDDEDSKKLSYSCTTSSFLSRKDFSLTSKWYIFSRAEWSLYWFFKYWDLLIPLFSATKFDSFATNLIFLDSSNFFPTLSGKTLWTGTVCIYFIGSVNDGESVLLICPRTLIKGGIPPSYIIPSDCWKLKATPPTLVAGLICRVFG